jgi:tripartite ATP-independent transporter DctP family solute receptor
MKRFLTLLAVVLALAALLAPQVQAQEIVFAHGANPGNPRYDAANMFAALVQTYAPGMAVKVAPSATLGDDAEMLTSATAGVIQMTANSQGTMAQIVPEVGMLGLPFLFSGLPNAWTVLDGPIGGMIDELAQKKGLKVITFWDNGIRHVTHIKKHIGSPDAVKGMKIRTPPDQVTLDIFKALGANPAPLAWSELPTALRAGTFDGQENPLTNIYSAKLHDITPYITMTGHKYECTPVVASLSWWKSLSKEQQDVIVKAAKEAGWYQRGRSMLDNAQLKAVMEKEGAKFMAVDQKAFAAATASVYDKYEKKFGDFVVQLKKAASGAK